MGEEIFNLPPGFRFNPTDEELVVHFLYRKAALLSFHPEIPELDLFYDPWELHDKALVGDNQWFFFTRRTHNRVTSNGYWKILDVDESITSSSKRVGVKKPLVFYIGEAPMGVKTSWMMQEYHLLDVGSGSRSSKKRGNPKLDINKWVLCRVYEGSGGDEGTELSCLDEVFLSLEDLDEISLPN